MPAGGSWSSAEDTRLAAAVKKHGDRAWATVAKAVAGGRTAAACQGRWMTHGNQNITRGGWTAKEDAALVKMFSDPKTPSWATRAIALGKQFHNGKRRGGAETCARYMLLKKQGKTSEKKQDAKSKKKGAKKTAAKPAKKSKK